MCPAFHPRSFARHPTQHPVHQVATDASSASCAACRASAETPTPFAPCSSSSIPSSAGSPPRRRKRCALHRHPPSLPGGSVHPHFPPTPPGRPPAARPTRYAAELRRVDPLRRETPRDRGGQPRKALCRRPVPPRASHRQPCWALRTSARSMSLDSRHRSSWPQAYSLTARQEVCSSPSWRVLSSPPCSRP